MTPAEIIEMKSPETSETPTATETNTEKPITTQQIYAELIASEMQAISIIRDSRKTRKTLLSLVNPNEPGMKIPTRHQYLSKVYREAAQNLLTTLRSMGVKATPHHVINPLAVRCDGVSGDGSRQITEFLYFENHGSVEPGIAANYDEIPENAVLIAEQSIGYTTVILSFHVNEENGIPGIEPITIVGKSICSGDDHYNGNTGIIFALKNAFEQIEARNINSPIRNLANLILNFQEVMALFILS